MNFKKLIAVFIPTAIAIFFAVQSGDNKTDMVSGTSTPKPSATATSISKISILSASRITKKPFSLYATPQNSPVQPERFSGYHSGADFETTPEEANVDVVVPALCDGKLLQKKTADGYGGVVVQSCILNDEPVTIVYGHVKLSSVTAGINQELKKGDQMGILGKGFSPETDGERKHLHLGIHKGTTISILGYVQKESDLENWLDPADFLK